MDIDTGSYSSYPSTDSLPSLCSDSSSDYYETSISPLSPSSPVPIAGENGNPHIFGFFPPPPASPPYHNQIPDPNHITPTIPLNNPKDSSIPVTLNAAQLVHLFLQEMHTPASDSEDSSDELWIIAQPHRNFSDGSIWKSAEYTSSTIPYSQFCGNLITTTWWCWGASSTTWSSLWSSASRSPTWNLIWVCNRLYV